MPVDAQPFPDPFPDSPTELALDPEVLARELAQELLGDPLDEIDAEERARNNLPPLSVGKGRSAAPRPPDCGLS